MIEVRSITETDLFLELKPFWNPLLEKSGSNNIFSTFEWLSTWWEHFGQDKKLFVLLAMDGEEVIGIAPLIIEKRRILRYAPLKVVSFIGTGVSDYADFIIVKKREEVLRGFFEYLGEKRRLWDEMDLREIREDSPNLELLREILNTKGFIADISETGKCPYVKIDGDWDGYFKSISKGIRKDIPNRFNRLRRLNIKWQVEIDILGNAKEYIDNLFDISISRVLSKNKKNVFHSKHNRMFIRTFIKNFADNKIIYLAIFRIDSNIAAYRLGFLYSGVFYAWSTSINNKYKKFSPGKLLSKEVFHNFFNRNISEIDFLRGEENYKYEWTKFARRNYRVIVRSVSLHSRIVFKVQDIYRSLKG